MEVKVNAFVIKSIDYKDNDKLLTLYSLESGKITASIKGVKKSGAKLKFASEPFCFAEYILAEKSGRYTVINASYIDSFYNLRLDLKKYYACAVVGEILNCFAEPDVSDKTLFSLAINAIKDICYNGEEVLTLCSFLHGVINSLGYGISDYTCACCGSVISGRVFFNFKNGVFSCQNCLKEGFNEIKQQTYNALLSVVSGTLNSEIFNESQIYLVKFLLYYLSYKTDVKLKSGDALISFLGGNIEGSK